jgi:hypothetical protein
MGSSTIPQDLQRIIANPFHLFFIDVVTKQQKCLKFVVLKQQS